MGIETQEKIAWRRASKDVAYTSMLTATPLTLFTVTGTVKVRLYGLVTASVTSGDALTLEVGISGNTACLLAQAAKTALLINTVWGTDATPGNPQAMGAELILTNGADIILTTGTANATAGAITVVCEWKKVSTDGNVAA